jgi:hypothetical protein
MASPTQRLSVSEHDSDNRIYECADAAAARRGVWPDLSRSLASSSVGRNGFAGRWEPVWRAPRPEAISA